MFHINGPSKFRIIGVSKRRCGGGTDGETVDTRRPTAAGGWWLWKPLFGALLMLVALPALVLLPEAGLPLAFLALRLLATRYAWAMSADRRLGEQLDRGGQWWRARSRGTRLLLGTAALAIAAAVISFTIVELFG